MRLKVLSVAVIVAIVLFSALPALAFWDDISSVVADGALNVNQIEDGVNALKNEVTSRVPGISGWLETIVAFLTTYLGDLFGWLS